MKPWTLAVSLLPLLIVVAAGAWLRYDFVPAHNAMYLDEPWYAEAACNLSRSGSLQLCETVWAGRACEPYQKAIGWPLILALYTSVVGCESGVGIAVNRALATATIVLVGATAMAAGATAWQGAFAATLIAFHPVHVRWSATGETNVVAAFFLLAGLCGAILYHRVRTPARALLAAAGFALATAIRPESLLAAVAVAVVAAILGDASLRRRVVTALTVAGPAAAAALSALPLWSMNRDISQGHFLSIANIAAALANIGQSGSWRVHGAVATLALVGAALLYRRERAVAASLAAASLAVAALALAYDRFADRMLIGPTVALAPAAAFALAWVEPGLGSRWRSWLRRLGEVAVVVLLLVSWRAPLRSTAMPPVTQLLETRLVEAVAAQALPPGALIIAEQPAVLTATGLRDVMSAEEALRDRRRLAREIAAGRSVYFLRDMYCEAGFQGGAAGAGERCALIQARFGTALILEERIHSRSYALYALSVPAQTPH